MVEGAVPRPLIVRREENGDLVLLRQVDHAALSGELAARLRDPPAPVSALVAGAREHDNGWREADEAPLLNAQTGEPHSYHDIPPAPYLELWERGIARAIALEPYLGLLVALHGGRFFQKAESKEERAFFERTRDAVDALLRALGLGGSWDALPDPARTHAEAIRFLDGLSLFACEAWDSPWRASVLGSEVTTERRSDGAITLRPWPFREAFEVQLEARVLERAPRFADEATMRAAIAAAPTRALSFRFRPS